MITFGVNRSQEKIHQAAAAVLQEKPLAHYNKFERIGLSEGFMKTVSGKQDTEQVNIGGFGFAVERNALMNTKEREMPIVSLDEYKNGAKGVSEDFFATNSFADDDRWLEGLCLDVILIVEVFNIVVDAILILKGKNLATILKQALMGNPRTITSLTRLVEEMNNIKELPFIDFKIMPNINSIQRVHNFMKGYTLKNLIELILNHQVLGEAVGLYDEAI